MFLKTVIDGSIGLYECDQLQTSTMGSSDGQDVLLITLESHNAPRALIEIDRKAERDVSVFVMNEYGRTVDTLYHREAGDRFHAHGCRLKA